MLVTRVSTLTGENHQLDIAVTQSELDRFSLGDTAQTVWPHLDRAVREYIVSGITPTEWATYFG